MATTERQILKVALLLENQDSSNVQKDQMQTQDSTNVSKVLCLGVYKFNRKVYY